MSYSRSGKTPCTLYVTHYYPPESNAPANRVSAFARAWAARGDTVEVLTGMPHHPTGIIPPGYRGRWYMRELRDGIPVHRTRIYPAANRRRVRRILNYLSFMVSAVITGTLRVGPVHCVVATSPHLFCAVAGWLLAIVKRAPFVFEVRDVWPAEIVAVGAIRNHIIIRGLELLEMFLYRRADRIIAVAQGTVDILTARGISRGKITLIPNGVSTDRFVPGPKQNPVREAHGLNGDFLVSYVGTVGMAHALDVILDAAELMRDNASVRFMIVGDGAERERLECEARRRGLTNILWERSQPHNRIADYYRASDACIVHLRKTELFTKNIPSKMYEIMSCARPMLLGTEGESRKLGLTAGCAVPFAPEDPHGLVRAVTWLARQPARGEKLGHAGRGYAVGRCDQRMNAEKYRHVLSEVISCGQSAAAKSSDAKEASGTC